MLEITSDKAQMNKKKLLKRSLPVLIKIME